MLALPSKLFTFNSKTNTYVAELSELRTIAREFTMMDSERGVNILFMQYQRDIDADGDLQAIRFRGITHSGERVLAVVFND